VSILDGPPRRTRSRAARFAFASPAPGSSFRCRLDGGAARSCTSPVLYERLAAGEHTFLVRAFDPAGNRGEAATYTWRILEEPQAASAPAADEQEQQAPTQEAGGQQAAAPSEGPPQATAEAKTEPAASGARSEPAATEQAATAEPPKDTTPPSISITSAPPSVTTKPVAVFRFQASEPVSRVECSLDGAGFSRCYTPTRYTLGIGPHTFCVRAIDRAKNVGSQACYAWTIEAKPEAPPTTAPPTTQQQPAQQPGTTHTQSGSTRPPRDEEPPSCREEPNNPNCVP
jgi:hypothetical protein